MEPVDVSKHVQELAEALSQLSPRDRQAAIDIAERCHVPPAHRTVLYMDEVAAMLGLDRLARPDNAVQRLVSRGDLPRRKINGRLVFARADVERLMENGGRKSRRGRPPGSKNRRRVS